MIMPIIHHIRKKKMSFLRSVFPVILLLIFCFSEAEAETIKTINVSMPTNYGTFLGEIHYAEKDLTVALKTERIVKEDLIKVINYFEYVPHDVVHFNLDPYLRLTNGNARPFPTNIINLYNFPANNKEHLIVMDNWLQGLVVHEFIHIVHLDQTRDYLQVGRNIFGTIAKIPSGIVPRWFTEGIAVWGESNLIEGGRLHNPLFNKELQIQFRKHDFCSTIDCVDEPGAYPHGSLSYWAGAHFIQWLEEKKTKTIKCLVERNSMAVPFFLNNAFEYCVGEKAQHAFTKFRDEFMAADPAAVEDKQWGEKISNAHGSDDYQRGHILDGNKLYKVEVAKFSQALVAYDLEDEVSFIQRFDLPISDLAGMVDVDNENKMLLISFEDDPRYRKHNKVWKLVNPETLLVERTLNFEDDPSYVIPLGGEGFLTFSYWKNTWTARRNNDVVKTFSTNDNLTLVRKVGEQLLLKLNDSFGNTSLVLTDVSLKNLSVIYKSNASFEMPLITEKFAVIREGKEIKLLEWDKKVQISSLPPETFAKLTFAEFNDTRTVVLENRLKTATMTASEAVSLFTRNASNTKAVEVSEYKSIPGPGGSYASERSENYPRWDHLIPHFWFLATGTSENLGSIGAMTTFVDPMELHTLNATLLTYPEVSKVGGSLEYLQKLIRWSDLWYVSAFFNQDYSKTDFSTHLDSSRDFTLSTFYSVYKGRWTYIPSLYAGNSSTDDFISDRSTSMFGVGNRLLYKALAYDDFFQYFTGSFSLQSNHANIGSAYLSTHVDADIGGRFTDKFTASLKGTYGRFYKTDFTRGVIYGGGVSDFAKIRKHEFYGIPYSNAFGNEVFTARFMGDYELWDIYRGRNLWPIFFKEIHVLFGRETMYADRIFLNNQVLREKLINGLFAGPRVKMNIFYFVPANFDLIFSSIAHPDGSNVNQVDAVLTAELF